MLNQVEARASGIRNVVPDGPNTTMGQLIDDCVRATGSDAVPVWMDEGFLLSQGVQPWAEYGTDLAALPQPLPGVPDRVAERAGAQSGRFRGGAGHGPETGGVRHVREPQREARPRFRG